MALSVYIDESGNTGLQLYDPKQPIYSIAGICVPEKNNEDLHNVFGHTKRAFRLQGDELKGNRLIGSANGQNAILHLAKELKQAGIMIALLVVHKPYHAVGWIIHDCFDYAHNSSVDEQWTWDRELRLPAQNEIMKLASPETLRCWWEARRQCNAAGMKESIEQLIMELSVNPYGLHLGQLLSGFDAEDLAETSRLTVKNLPIPKQQNGISPNVTSFIGYLQCIDQDAKEMGIPDICVIHDEQREFSDNFSWWADSIGNLKNNKTEADRKSIVLPDGLILPSFTLPSLKRFSMEKSLEYPGIQIADCFASLARVVGEYSFRNDITSIPPLIRKTLLELNETPHFPEAVGPASWQRDTINLLSGRSTALIT